MGQIHNFLYELGQDGKVLVKFHIYAPTSYKVLTSISWSKKRTVSPSGVVWIPFTNSACY